MENKNQTIGNDEDFSIQETESENTTKKHYAVFDIEQLANFIKIAEMGSSAENIKLKASSIVLQFEESQNHEGQLNLVRSL